MFVLRPNPEHRRTRRINTLTRVQWRAGQYSARLSRATQHRFQFLGTPRTLVGRVGTPLPSSHSVGMQQNWLVGLTVAPMKLATSG
jgi:hypothetical protein